MSRPGGLRLSDSQRFDWIRLTRTEGIGPRGFQGLINRFGGAAAALAALPDLARARGRTIRIPHPEAIAREIEAAARLGVRFVLSGEAEYPAALIEIDAPPPVLALRGRPDLLERPCVAIVGARNASAPGRRMAARLARGLSEAGYTIVSGLARGIDAEAHRESLAGGTAAVLAGGLDRPYPPENAALYDEILARGLALSEMPLGLSPRGRDFPRRNRLVSGLSRAVIVVEAARRSGSLITARFAAEQGREVFAVPGSPLDPRCEGSNDLLRAGASIATAVEDVLAILTPLAGTEARAPRLFREPPACGQDDFTGPPDAGEDELFEDPDPADDLPQPAAVQPQPAEEALLALIAVAPVEIDQLARITGLPARAVQAALLELELAGRIVRHGGNRVSRAL
jgi:DNA processing protein